MNVKSYQNGDIVYIDHPRKGFISGVIMDQGYKKDQGYMYAVCSNDWPDGGWGLWVSQEDLDITNNETELMRMFLRKLANGEYDLNDIFVRSKVKYTAKDILKIFKGEI